MVNRLDGFNYQALVSKRLYVCLQSATQVGERIPCQGVFPLSLFVGGNIMQQPPITISGFGYLHDILELGGIAVVRIKPIHLLGKIDLTDVVWLEAVIQADLRAFLKRQLAIQSERYATLLEFLATVLNKRGQHQEVSVEADLLVVSEVYKVKKAHVLPYDTLLKHC